MKTYTSAELSLPANSALLEEIVLLISHAFTDDPGTKWLLSNHTPDSYMRAVPAYFRVLVNLSLLSDASITVITNEELTPPANLHLSQAVTSKPKPQIELLPSSTIRALTVTIPPHGNATFDSALAGIRAGALLLPFKTGVVFTWKLLSSLLPSMEVMHKAMFPDRALTHHNWHLLFIATHSDHQGQGLGKRLLVDLQTSVKEWNKEERRRTEGEGTAFKVAPLYLEASSLDSKRLYNRVGFEDRAELSYGSLEEGQEFNIAEDGSVIGGKLFGMVWTP